MSGKAPSSRSIKSVRQTPYDEFVHSPNLETKLLDRPRSSVSSHPMMTRRKKDLLDELKSLEDSYENVINDPATEEEKTFSDSIDILREETMVWNENVMTSLTNELYRDDLYNEQFYSMDPSNPQKWYPKRKPIYDLTKNDSSTVNCMALTAYKIFETSKSNVDMIKSDSEDPEKIYKYIYQYRQEPSYEDDYKMIIYDALSGIFYPNPRLNHALADYVSRTSRKDNKRNDLIRDVYSFTIENAGAFMNELLELKENSVSVLNDGVIVQHGTPIDRIDGCNNYIRYGVPLFSGISCKLLDNNSIYEFLGGKVISFPVRSFTLDYRVAEHFAYTRPVGEIDRIEFDKVIFIYLCKENIPYVSPHTSWEGEAIFASSNFIYLSHSIINNRLLIYITLIPIDFNLSSELVETFIKGKQYVASGLDTDIESDTEGGRRTRRLRKSRKNRSRSKRGKSYKGYKKRQRKTNRNPFAFTLLH
jgi:hypothetical protein